VRVDMWIVVLCREVGEWYRGVVRNLNMAEDTVKLT
jgi:hypothetical protein